MGRRVVDRPRRSVERARVFHLGLSMIELLDEKLVRMLKGGRLMAIASRIRKSLNSLTLW